MVFIRQISLTADKEAMDPKKKARQNIFSCMDSRQPTNFIDSHIERIRAKLSPLEIDVKWYELRYLDYADSVW